LFNVARFPEAGIEKRKSTNEFIIDSPFNTNGQGDYLGITFSGGWG
jgi:hypothetical protein